MLSAGKHLLYLFENKQEQFFASLKMTSSGASFSMLLGKPHRSQEGCSG
jgi:hypothetical protein